MTADPKRSRLEKFLRYLSAYAWFVFFTLLGLLIIWGLRSVVLSVCLVFSVPNWITKILYSWGTFIVLIPYVLMIPVLESDMNKAAKEYMVRKRVLKVLAIEGGIGLVVLAAMGILALSGYLPML